MKSQDFMEWTQKTGARFATDFVAMVGVSRPTAQIIYKAAKAGETVPISCSVALAMSAVANNLPPWGESETTNDRE